MKSARAFRIDLPEWCEALASNLPAALPDPQERISLAIELSRRNVEAGTGGPFGAVVCEADTGRLLAVGVNRVEPACCSSAHAEIVALSLAQAHLEDWNLRAHGNVELATSCEPCAMCFGAVLWSGIRRLQCAATKEDAERTGFDEGPRTPDWVTSLQQRGIEVVTSVLRERAARVLEDYSARGARIYNP